MEYDCWSDKKVQQEAVSGKGTGIGPIWLNPETPDESKTVESEDLAAWRFGQVR